MRSSLNALIVVVCGLLALAAALPGAAAAERRVALVIGNSVYKNSALDIPNARNDAEDVAAALKALGFDVLLETDVDLAAASKAIQQFARMSVGADSTLFYFAGHAVQYQGHNYLLPVDAEVKDEISLPFETIAVDNIRAVLDRSNGVKIMVLDACRNNPIADRLAKMASAAPAIDPSERTRGLERIDKSEGIIVAFATSPGDVALDGQERNSPFTKAFLKRLNEPGLEVEMMFRRIANDVREATSGRQRPETYVSLVNEYYLNQTDRVAWEKVKETDDPAALHDFVERFPSSFYAIEARYRLKALERAIAEQKARALKEAELARREKEVAAQEAAARLKADEACRTERAALAAASPRDAEALRRLSASACEEVKGAAQKRLADLEATFAAEAEACRRDAEALAGLSSGRDVDALHALMRETPCVAVKTSAAARIGAVEADLAKAAEICQREESELKGLVERGDGAGLEGLRSRSACPATLPAIAQGLRTITAAAKAACERDASALQAIPERDAASLRAFVAHGACDPVKATAQTRLRELESVLAREEAQCRSEQSALKDLIARGDSAGVGEFRSRARCPAAIAAAETASREIAAAADAACARDNAALNALAPRDVAALRALSDRSSCGAVKTAAAQRLEVAEAALRQEAEACGRDEAQWKDLSGSGDKVAIEAFRKRVDCGRLAPAIERRIAELKTICRADDAALAALNARDADGLRSFLGKAQCDDAKAEAAKRLAALEAAAQREAEICRRDGAQWAERAGSANRADVEAFVKGAECAAVKSAAERRLAELGAICKSDAASLAALGARDAAGLSGFIGKAQCDEVKTDAKQRLARLETVLARDAQICQRDEALMKDVSSADREAFTALRQRAECPSVLAALDRTLADLKQACQREQDALSAIGVGDGAATKSFLESAVCGDVKTAARAKLARIEANEAKAEEACRREDVELTALKTQGAAARGQLDALKGRLTCARLRPDIEAALSQLPEPPPVNTKPQIRAAQTELQRLGCLGPIETGALDGKTRAGFARYFEAKGENAPSASELKVTDEILTKLEGDKAGLCPPADVAEPIQPVRRSKKDLARVPPAEEPSQKAASRPAREKAARPAPAERPVRVAKPQPEQRPRPAPAAPPAQATANKVGGHSASPLGVGF
ncbi:peptidase C14 caspase catalytic subunit p20 [Methylocella silvestris BL2]|uniref:Peptidase C14 caspase catalytic subunit p20 n=1 Tax=Methylocella silvestris (strain DSM 15510 / CIP 108128 / LMG 27833 / NCIMB 13906 / BL2) TaxID=395965 RepID=B8ETF9_METSB|nr:caspase family protein [Methylocella silvestris]ACK51801.1 peptidase C14 caspase catalytic subunit p20 [Methylocella silvestris BL2]